MVPKEFEEFLGTPDAFDLPDAVCPRKVPFTRAWVDNWAEVAATRWDAQLIVLADRSKVKAQFGRISRAGCFGVVKKLSDLLRLVIDRRGPNAQEHDLLTALRLFAATTSMPEDVLNLLERLLILPHSCQTTDIILGPGSYLLINVDDISDYYYTSALPWPRVLQTSIGYPVSGKGLLWAGAQRDNETLLALGDDDLECCLTAPAMGDQKAAGIAQIVNQAALQSHGLLREKETWMSYGFSPPNSSVWEGVYLDDKLSLGIVDPAGPLAETEQVKLIEKCVCLKHLVVTMATNSPVNRKNKLGGLGKVFGRERSSRRGGRTRAGTRQKPGMSLWSPLGKFKKVTAPLG